MAAKNRRTKQKNRSDSSSDDSSAEDDSSIIKRLRNNSYVNREKQNLFNKTKNVLNDICDSDDDDNSDSKRKNLLKRPISTVPSVANKNTSKKKAPFPSEDSSSDSNSTKKHSNSKTKATTSRKLKAKSAKLSESESESENFSCKNKSTIVSKEKKSVISHKKFNNNFNESDESSSKEFQKPKVTETVKPRTSYMGEHVYDDYTFLETPTKSDEESIPVDKKHEISLKHHIIEEFDKIQKITNDLKETLEYNSEYVVSKKVKVVGDSKFLAHKILRLYDSTYEKLKESKNSFFRKYSEWVNACNKNKSIKDGSFSKSIAETSFRSRFKISSDDSMSDSDDGAKKKSNFKNKCSNVKKNKISTKKMINSSESDSSDAFEKKKDLNSTGKKKELFEKKKSFNQSRKVLAENNNVPTIGQLLVGEKFSKASVDNVENDGTTECEAEENLISDNPKEKPSRAENDAADVPVNKEVMESEEKEGEIPSEKNEADSCTDKDEVLKKIEENVQLSKSRGETNEIVYKKKSILFPKSLKEQKNSTPKKVGKSCSSSEQSKSDKENDKSCSEGETNAKEKEKETSERSKSISVEEAQENYLKDQVSECDSDEIFSNDESRVKKSDKNEEVTKEKLDEVLQEREVVSKKLNYTNANSEDLFDSTASEIASSPIKSPILSFKKTLRKNVCMTLRPPILSDLDDDPDQEDPLLLTNREEESEAEKGENERDEETVEEQEARGKNGKSEEENEASGKEDSKGDSELEARIKLLQNSESSLSSDSEVDDVESTKEDDSDALSADRDASDRLLLPPNKTENSSTISSTESRAKAKRLTKKTKRLPLQTKTRNNLSIDSSSSEDQLPTRPKRGASKKRALSHDSDSNVRNLLPVAKRPRRSSSFNVRNNRHYKADPKLHKRCQIVLERLPQRVLDKYSRALAMSKTYVANKKFNSLTNLDGLESKKKSKKHLDSEATDNDNDKSAKAKKKSKKQKKSNTSQIDEENDVETDESNNVNDNEFAKSCDNSVDQDLSEEAENEAKEALFNSSSSDDENEESKDVDENEETPKKVRPKLVLKIKKNDTIDGSNKQIKNEVESDENIEIKKNKNDWKQDSLLTFKITDTESDEEKFKKSQEKKKARKEKEANNKSGEDIEISEESPVKEKVSRKGRKQRKARRILDSDSDAKIDTSEEEEEVQEEEEEENSDDEEFEIDTEKEGKKKKGKKRRQKSSGSDTSSSEKKSKSKRKRIKKVASDDSDSDKDSPNKGRKNIRKVLKDKHVADDTKKAAQNEEERLRRIADRQRIFNEMYESKLAGEAKVEKLVLDFDEETKKELVVVDNELVKRLKPHQAQGIQFMWEACFESLKQIEKSEGGGCIIAHCMGLGKTFQVVTLVHTLLSHEETNVKTVMVVCPLSTVLNWVNEFKMWLKHTKNCDDIEIYELTKLKKNIERKYMLESWKKTGGVLIIGYEMFRNLTSTGKKMRKAMQESVTKSLVDPGADLVVCDEGHLLKNEDSALSKAMRLIRTMRRIVLTGTPLQNNLKEYHCMVQFVKPNLLGTKKEFLNRFVNPITNGQFDDSTPYDVKLMKKRAHVLHKMLEGCVQRFDYSVLTPFLPPKQEYVIFVRLTEVQIKMYQHYLDNFARRFSGRNGSLFADFQELQRIWTHPYVLRLNAEKIDKANEKKRLEASDSEGSLKDFIDDDSESEASVISSSNSGSGSDVQFVDSDSEKQRPVKMTRAARMNLKEDLQEEVPIVQATTEETAWWSQFVEEEHFEDLRISTKLLLLFGILSESEQIGDKVLVFSQSLYSLTLIEYFLNLIDQETQNGGERAETLDNHSGTWSLGLDYFRLDGSTSAENRSAWCKIFNNPNNTRARLFLISTRAGGLGINLTAANRVIIFDASWNPSHDVQSIFRVYRFGQKKPCYIYRFLAAGTMEEKIYNRQVTKLSLACRVVDEQQIERHYSNNDLAELYQFESYQDQQTTLALPKDRMLAEIFLKYKDNVYNYHEHDSLLENKEEEELDEEERKQAWLEYEEEKQGKRQMVNMNMGNMMGFNHMLLNMNNFPELENIKLMIQKEYPNIPPEHLETVARQAIFDMYRYVDQSAMNQTLNPFGMANQMQQNMFGNAAMPAMTQQQHTINQQNQLMNLLNQPAQMNYQGVNHMPAYSGRGRPPKHLSNPMYNPMKQTPMQSSMQVPNMQMPMQAMQLQQPQMQAQLDNSEIEVLTEKRGTSSNNDIASNSNNQPEE